MAKRIIRKSNALIESHFSISLMEMRVFLSVLSKVKYADKAFKEYRIYYSDIGEQMNLKLKGKTYEVFRDAAESLKFRKMRIKEGNRRLAISMFSSVESWKGESYIDICFDPKLKPYLIDLKTRYTSYDIQNVIRCKSVYSIRIYELLKQYQKLDDRRIFVDELKNILGFTDKQYRLYADLKRWILEPARRELKKYSDIYFTYDTKKKGRKIHSIVFHIHKKRQRRMDFDKDEEIPYLSFEEVMQEQEQIKQQPPEPYKP